MPHPAAENDNVEVWVTPDLTLPAQIMAGTTQDQNGVYHYNLQAQFVSDNTIQATVQINDVVEQLVILKD